MKRFLGYIGAALSVLLVIVSSTPTFAADASSALSINPRKNYTIKPGQTITDKLHISNLDHASILNLNLRMIDFTFMNESGSPKFNLAQDASPTPWSLRSFTKLPKTVEIPAGGSKTIDYSITIPKNLGAGSYYSAIIYQAAGTNGGNVALNASGVTLVFVNIPGKAKESMSLQKLGAYNSDDNGTTGSYVYIDTNEQPKMIAFALKNEGNVFESPAGQITLKDIFGHMVSNITVNTKQQLALIGQTRLFTSCIKTKQQAVQALGGASKDETCINPGLAPGLYKIHLDVHYSHNELGGEDHAISGTAYFWYLPWWFIAVVLILLALIAYGVWWLRRKIKTAIKGTSYKAGRGISRRKPRG